MSDIRSHIKMLTCFLLMAVILAGVGLSEAAQRYWNDDENYPIIFYGNQGIAYALDKSSVQVDEYNPPVYQIEGIIYAFDFGDKQDSSSKRVERVTYRYNYDKRQIYKIENDGSCRKLQVSGKYNAVSDRRVVAEALSLFEVAYNMAFPINDDWKTYR